MSTTRSEGKILRSGSGLKKTLPALLTAAMATPSSDLSGMSLIACPAKVLPALTRISTKETGQPVLSESACQAPVSASAPCSAASKNGLSTTSGLKCRYASASSFVRAVSAILPPKPFALRCRTICTSTAGLRVVLTTQRAWRNGRPSMVSGSAMSP
ncbi:MAG TPA: hypothetical protein PLS81_07680 [Deltaproteobacteria bacterium]|nr:hypothetical protein [Deltaproteobacteria bacterium]